MSAPGRLRVRAVLADAVARVRARIGPLLRALLLPAAALAALGVAQVRVAEDPMPGFAREFALFFASAIPYAVFAVSCHRILLLGTDALPQRWGLYFTRRELRFLGWMLVTGVLFALALLPTIGVGSALMAAAPARVDQPVAGFVLLTAVASLPAWYVLSRASLVLPASAIDERPTLGQAWRRSRGNGWRLSFALAIPLAAIWGLTWLLGVLLAPLPEAVAAAGVALIGNLLTALEIAALSVAFEELGGLADRALPEAGDAR